MKRLGIIATVGLAICFLAGYLQAAPAASKSLTVSASVPNVSPVIDVVVFSFTDGNPDNDPWTNSTDETGSGTLNFGQLTNLRSDGSNAGLWYANKGYCIVTFATGYGKKYEITQTASIAGLDVPQAFGIIPVYSSTDKWTWGSGPNNWAYQGSMPTGATLGTSGPATTTSLIYRSESPTGTDRIIQVYYGIPPYNSDGSAPFPGYQPIPLSHPPVTVSGSVQISIAPY